jgi:predicted nucleic acid-binding protein
MSGIDHLLDTNVVIGLLKGHPPAIELAHQAGLAMERAGISPITRMELLGFPGLTAEEERAARVFLDACQIVALDEKVERHAIRLRRSGQLKLPDAIIAGSALAVGARLLTLDQRLARIHEAQSGI